MAGETILVVDDNPTNLKLIKTALRDDNYNVLIATSAEEALSVIDNVKPHLILTDIKMPGISGLELASFLKQSPKTKNIPIIAISSNALKGERENTIKAGCQGYITKPIDVLKLPALVSEYLNSLS